MSKRTTVAASGSTAESHVTPTVIQPEEEVKLGQRVIREPRSRVIHLGFEREMDAAREMGVYAKTLCGVWRWPKVVEGDENAADGCPRCKRCARAYERLQGDVG